ncbi:EamA family transporter [Candidatus Woesearchaeota archaeon]|jgi:drug/metabolite transporter (DMT)-like permease|nr:EamA family transporter [Candidatus Woesearchaeota archaeon]
MNSWLIFGLIPPALWAICNLVDSKLRTKYIKDDFLLTAVAGIVGLLVFVLVPFKGMSFPGWSIALIALGTGILYIYAMVPYFKALSFEDASSVILLWFIAQIIVPFGAKFFLNESLVVSQYVGFGLVLIGGLLISIKRDSLKKLTVSKALFLMLLSGVLLDVYYMLEKYVYQHESFWNGFFWIRLGSFVGALTIILMPKYWCQFKKLAINFKSKSWKLVFSTEIINIIALISIGYAISIGSVSLVISLINFQPLFILILVIILSKFFPHLYEENLDKKTLTFKIIAVILLVIGLFLVGA